MHRLFVNACAHFDNPKSMGWRVTRFLHKLSPCNSTNYHNETLSMAWCMENFLVVLFFLIQFFFRCERVLSSQRLYIVTFFRNTFVSVAQFPNPNSVTNHTHTHTHTHILCEVWHWNSSCLLSLACRTNNKMKKKMEMRKKCDTHLACMRSLFFVNLFRNRRLNAEHLICVCEN